MIRLIDLSNKSISLYDKKLSDSFCDVIKDINKIEIDNIDSGKKIKKVMAGIDIDAGELMIALKDMKNTLYGVLQNIHHV